MKKPPKTLTPEHVPRNVRITPKVREAFTRGVLREVATRFKRSAGDWIGAKDVTSADDVAADDVAAYNLHAFEHRNKVWWSVVSLTDGDGASVIAGGFLRYTPRWKALQGVRAAVHKNHRRRGLYTWVLRELRRHFKRPLLSSAELSEANALLWGRVGVSDPASGLYRMNPRSRGIEDYVTALLAVED